MKTHFWKFSYQCNYSPSRQFIVQSAFPMALEVLYSEKDKYGQYFRHAGLACRTESTTIANILQDHLEEANSSNDSDKQLHLFQQVRYRDPGEGEDAYTERCL